MRILGIDLGTTSIKAVELDSAFGRYEIHDYHEIPRPPGRPPGEAIAQLMGTLAKTPDRIAVAMKTGQMTFRNLNLPTRDKKAIIAGVGFELEDELPFSLDDAAYEFSVLNQTKQSTYIHIAATLKKHLAAFLHECNESGLDPDTVTTEAWAYRALLNRVLGTQGHPIEKPVLLVQIGHEHSTLYLHFRGAPVVARELGWGGRDLTTAICQKYQIPVEEAEAAKLDHGFVVPFAQRTEVTPEQIEFSDTLMEPVQALLSAIRQAELSCKNITHEPLSLIYLSGGTAQLPGLAKVVEETLNLPVRPLQALSSIATSGVTYSEQTDAVFLLAASLALAQAGTDRIVPINFRKGDFARPGQTRELSLMTLRKPLLAMAAIAVCFFASTLVQSRVYQARIQETDSQLEKSVRGFFGTLSTSAAKTYMSNTTTLKGSINKELTKQRDIAKLVGPNPHSPLDFLRELSTTISKDVVVDMTQYQVGAAPATPYAPTGESQASLSFLVSNPQLAERLNTLLTNKLSGLERGKMEEASAADGTKRWRVTFSGKPTEDSYGK
ncbi:pilus assembly protein PilM [Bdellovibrionota bacterium FG-1]